METTKKLGIKELPTSSYIGKGDTEMFYKEDMELKLLQFGRKQLDTELYILNKDKQLYEDALFWDELALIYLSGNMFSEAASLSRVVHRMIN